MTCFGKTTPRLRRSGHYRAKAAGHPPPFQGVIRHHAAQIRILQWISRALGVVISRLRSFPSPAGPSCSKVGTMDTRQHAFGSEGPSESYLSSQTGSIRSLARSVQISRASPARLLWSAFQSLQNLPRTTGDVLRPNFEHEGRQRGQCISPGYRPYAQNLSSIHAV